MFPHERSLVEKYKDQPFALLGVNTDSDKEDYRRQVETNKINWRSAWTGGKDNPISRQFKIEGYPTVFLLDGSGKIRKKWLGAPPPATLEKAIDELLAESKPAK